jgi:hypothetical protein
MTIDWNNFTPWSSLSGGVLIGLATAMFLLLHGRIAGISLSEMTDPSKVVGLLDVAGNWNSSLAFVMAGAIAVGFVAFPLVATRPKLP